MGGRAPAARPRVGATTGAIALALTSVPSAFGHARFVPGLVRLDDALWSVGGELLAGVRHSQKRAALPPCFEAARSPSKRNLQVRGAPFKCMARPP
eukprot:6221614-Pyramimonas_sp.AAC.1